MRDPFFSSHFLDTKTKKKKGSNGSVSTRLWGPHSHSIKHSSAGHNVLAPSDPRPMASNRAVCFTLREGRPQLTLCHGVWPKKPKPASRVRKSRLLVPSPTLPAPWWPNQADGSPQLLPIFNSGAVGIVPCASCLWDGLLCLGSQAPSGRHTPSPNCPEPFRGLVRSIIVHHPSPITITRLAPLSPLRCRPEALLYSAPSPHGHCMY